MPRDLQQGKGMVGTALVLVCLSCDRSTEGHKDKPVLKQPSTEHHLQEVLLPPARLNTAETPLFTPVTLTLISKAEIKIFATETRFLTKELGSWAYIQSKNSESS